VDEDIFAAIITLDEAEALACVEEFYRALGCAHDLRRHPATATRTAAETTAAATAAIIATETATFAAAKATTTVIESLIAAEAALRERIETVFAKTIAFVAAAAATTSVITHKTKRTLLLALSLDRQGLRTDSHRANADWPSLTNPMTDDVIGHLPPFGE